MNTKKTSLRRSNIKNIRHPVKFMTGQFEDSTKFRDKLSGMSNKVMMAKRISVDDYIMHRHLKIEDDHLQSHKWFAWHF